MAGHNPNRDHALLKTKKHCGGKYAPASNPAIVSTHLCFVERFVMEIYGVFVKGYCNSDEGELMDGGGIDD